MGTPTRAVASRDSASFHCREFKNFGCLSLRPVRSFPVSDTLLPSLGWLWSSASLRVHSLLGEMHTPRKEQKNEERSVLGSPGQSWAPGRGGLRSP